MRDEDTLRKPRFDSRSITSGSDPRNESFQFWAVCFPELGAVTPAWTVVIRLSERKQGTPDACGESKRYQTRNTIISFKKLWMLELAGNKVRCSYQPLQDYSKIIHTTANFWTLSFSLYVLVTSQYQDSEDHHPFHFTHFLSEYFVSRGCIGFGIKSHPRN